MDGVDMKTIGSYHLFDFLQPMGDGGAKANPVDISRRIVRQVLPIATGNPV